MGQSTMASDTTTNPFDGIIQALIDRQSQLDVRMEHVSLKVPFLSDKFELNGTISLSIHMRGLTEKEKQAHVSKNLKALAP
ncbi:MAG: hypothetical protein L3K09_08810 [Thermoplasmata archaeon]|nr:hypothetical protein [Thermoplasmata archaeon]